MSLGQERRSPGVDAFSLDSAVALVVGGAGGIGVAVARELQASGAQVAVADRVQESEARAVLKSVGATAAFSVHQVDVTDETSCQQMIAAVVKAHGSLDVVVNCFGINDRAATEEMSIASWDRIMNINLTGVLRVCQAAYPELADGRRSAIVNLASTAGKVAIADNAHYSVSKAGVMHLTKVLANDWASRGIRVNAVGPTIVPTAMTADVRDDPSYMEAKLASIPLGRMVTTAEVAYAVRFLASPAAAMITGQTLFVDGGVTLR